MVRYVGHPFSYPLNRSEVVSVPQLTSRYNIRKAKDIFIITFTKLEEKAEATNLFGKSLRSKVSSYYS